MVLEIQDIICSVTVPILIKDDFIRNGRFKTVERTGTPQACVGGFSIVFPVDVNGETWAFRCWHHTIEDAQERIRLLSEELKKVKEPYFIPFEYVSQGIVVNGRIFPTTRMKWINGYNIKEYICKYRNDKNKLIELALSFFEMTCKLHHHSIAHGDFQHENILVDSNGRLYLIDYDSMYVPSLAYLNTKNSTNGKDGYQHPARERCIYASEKLDYFSEAVILTSIIAIAINPELITKYRVEDSDCLLFSKSDFANFSSSMIYNDLQLLEDNLICVLLNVISYYLKKSDISNLMPIDITINYVCPTNVISVVEYLRKLSNNGKKEDGESPKGSQGGSEKVTWMEEFDIEDWERAKKVDNINAYEGYLRKWPNGEYEKDARERISKLRHDEKVSDIISHIIIAFFVILAISVYYESIVKFIKKFINLF